MKGLILDFVGAVVMAAAIVIPIALYFNGY